MKDKVASSSLSSVRVISYHVHRWLDTKILFLKKRQENPVLLNICRPPMMVKQKHAHIPEFKLN